MTLSSGAPSRPLQPLSGAYRAVWRWHFYAGLMVLPVLMLMALTGGLYLFKAEIESALYGGLSRVEARGETVSPDRWTAAAEIGLGGVATSVFVPDQPDRTAWRYWDDRSTFWSRSSPGGRSSWWRRASICGGRAGETWRRPRRVWAT